MLTGVVLPAFTAASSLVTSQAALVASGYSVITPASPTGLIAAAQGSAVRLTWTAPVSSGDSPISDYAIQASTDAGTSWVTLSHATTTTTSISVTGLSNLVPQVFRVAAINRAGTGTFSSNSQAVVPSDSVLAIRNGTNKANGLGLTLVSTVGAKLYYNTPTNFDGLPANMKLYVSGVQVASVTFTSPYAGRPFVFERVVAGVSSVYSGSVAEGRVDLSAVTPSPLCQ